MLKQENAKFCTRCGRTLVKIIVSAEKIRKSMTYFHPKLYGHFWHPFDKFNTKTGKRQYASYYRCPKKWFWHDEYEDDAELI